MGKRREDCAPGLRVPLDIELPGRLLVVHGAEDRVARIIVVEATRSEAATTDGIAVDMLREVTKYVAPATPIDL